MSKHHPDDALIHFGVKGMRWGVRKSDPGGPSGVSRSTNKEAAKDAEEFTRAKLYYGEGAGTRRKLINNTVAAKARKDPSYKAAFDHHVANTDLSKRASQARKQRSRTDKKTQTVKTAKGVRHILNGNSQYANASAALLVGGAMYARKTGIDQTVARAAKKTWNDVRNFRGSSSERAAQEFLRSMGL